MTLHEITKPISPPDGGVTARNYGVEAVSDPPKSLQIGPEISRNAFVEIAPISSEGAPDPSRRRGGIEREGISTLSYSTTDADDDFGLPVADLAWAAGFFDGEGCIIGARVSSPNGPQYVLTVTVGQVDRRPLDYLAGLFGGNVRLNKTATAKSQQFHLWAIHDGYARNFLRSVRPYLRVKGERADLALRMGAKALYERPNRQTTLAARRLREDES